MLAQADCEPLCRGLIELDGKVVAGEQRLGLGQKRYPVRRGANEARGTLQQAAAQLGFEAFESLAYDRLNGSGGRSRAGEVAKFDRQNKQPNGFEIQHD